MNATRKEMSMIKKGLRFKKLYGGKIKTLVVKKVSTATYSSCWGDYEKTNVWLDVISKCGHVYGTILDICTVQELYEKSKEIKNA